MNTIEKYRKPKGSRVSENIRRHIGESLTIRWGTSRGRDSYGYTTCSLRNHRGERVAACNGGGYDMMGTVIGNWLAATFPTELCALKESQMPARSHWERAEKPRRVCRNVSCHVDMLAPKEGGTAIPEGKAQWLAKTGHEFPYVADGVETCPFCGGETAIDHHDGKTVQDGRSFYGLCFYDPTYNALDGKLERADGTFTKPEDVGKTFRELKAAGRIVDLDLIRHAYSQTSKHSTARHTRPSIDGACGTSSVLEIARAIGISLRQVASTSKLHVYIIEVIEPAKKERAA